MPLLEIWNSAPEAVEQMSIEQIVSSAGNGMLKDASPCSIELRDYLAQIPSSKIASYMEHCLSNAFIKGGMVLQDLVNELGRRLDYKVTNGRYQGVAKEIGFDGLWISPEGHAVIAEVKTTDAYRISLETIVAYRSKLTTGGQISSTSSILIVVGREDTGELEAQVRGSRHAWDIRLISADALVKLVQLKENTEGSETGSKIRTLLAPMEYTRIDRLIDVMFATATDVEGATVAIENETQDASLEISAASDNAAAVVKTKGAWQFTDSGLIQAKRDQIIVAMNRHAHSAFIKKSRAMFWNSTHDKRVACTISKNHSTNGGNLYWFGYRSQWRKFLSEIASEAFAVFGCMDVPIAFAIPNSVMETFVENLNTTVTEGADVYWHIHIVQQPKDGFFLQIPKKSKAINLEPYKIQLDE